MLYLASLDDITETGQPRYREPGTAPSPEDIMVDREVSDIRARGINEIVSTLTAEEQVVIRGLFGFEDRDIRTLRSLAAELGISEYRVGAIRDEAKNRLSIRATLHADSAILGPAR
jgi:DNA-directed RNA polymerase sigma subunit (sigma70/sigma32)